VTKATALSADVSIAKRATAVATTTQTEKEKERVFPQIVPDIQDRLVTKNSSC
jgi:hypothetical protein